MSLYRSVHLSHPLTFPRPSHKAQPPAPPRCGGRVSFSGRGEEWREEGVNVCSQSVTLFYFTDLERTALYFPPWIASPTSASVRRRHCLLRCHEGPAVSTPRSPRCPPDPASSGWPRGPPRTMIFLLSGVRPISRRTASPPTPRRCPPLTSRPPPGTDPSCCSS